MKQKLYGVRDDFGHLWFCEGGRLYLWSAEKELGEENGYACRDWNEGVRLLNEMGYIIQGSDEEEQDRHN